LPAVPLHSRSPWGHAVELKSMCYRDHRRFE
jgi:hypothetical protein